MAKKSRKPPIDLDALVSSGKLRVIEIDEDECNELRRVDLVDLEINRPISEIAMQMAAEMKAGKRVTVHVASTDMILTIRRLYMYDLERIVRGGGLKPRCIERGTVLTFDFVKDR